MKVGEISAKVITALGLSCKANTEIALSPGNIVHMQTKHPKEYAKYGHCIGGILLHPDYVGQNPTDQSIEYVKEFVRNGEFVKVAVRVSGGGTYFVRSIYTLNQRRVTNYISKGTLKKV